VGCLFVFQRTGRILQSVKLNEAKYPSINNSPIPISNEASMKKSSFFKKTELNDYYYCTMNFKKMKPLQAKFV